MTVEQQFWDLETQLWADPDRFLNELCHSEAVLRFPSPVGAVIRSTAGKALSAVPGWTAIDFSSQQSTSPVPAIVSLSYDVAGECAGRPVAASASSVYATVAGEWHLVAHHREAATNDER